MPKPRKLQICVTETPYYHLISRCVRRAFLCGCSETYNFAICVATTTEVELTEEIIASVLRDADFRTNFDPSHETYVEVKQQGCVTNTDGLYTAPTTPSLSQDGDARVVKQVRDGVTHVWEQTFSGGRWITVKYSYYKPFAKA